MNFITKLFSRSLVDCPRCLGKGKVNWDDIKRLKRELRWSPGKCAYCNGSGKVAANMVAKVAVDNTYLTIDISREERQRLINGDKAAFQRADQHDANVNDFILQIEYLHFIANLDPIKIAEFYLLPKSSSSIDERKELIEYIDRVIAKKKGNMN